MTLYVLIEQEPSGPYTASLIGWPGVTAQATTADEALSRLRQSLTRRLGSAQIVPLEVDVAGSDNPWLQTAGILQGDPFAGELQASIAAYRRELDAGDERA